MKRDARSGAFCSRASRESSRSRFSTNLPVSDAQSMIKLREILPGCETARREMLKPRCVKSKTKEWSSRVTIVGETQIGDKWVTIGLIVTDISHGVSESVEDRPSN